MHIIEDTNEGIFWNPKKDKPQKFLFVEYSFRTSINPRETAFFLAREHSVSTYTRLHGETKKLRERRSAKLVQITNKRFTIAYPIANIQGQIGELLVSTIGNGNFLHHKIFSKLIIEDFSFPPALLRRFEGPKYGKELLKWFSNSKRPLLIGVQKPSIGLPTNQHIKRALEAFQGGCDIVKDDEQLYPDDPANRLERRLQALQKQLPKLAKKNKRHFMYLFNLENETELLEYCQKISKNRTKKPFFGIMLSPLLGLPFIHFVRKHAPLPIFSHPSGFGIYTRGNFGFASNALAKILRLAGVDCIIHPGVYSKIAECTPKTAIDAKKACDQKLGTIKPCALAFGGGMRKENFKQTKKLMKGNDFIFLVGGAIFGHKKGPLLGAK